jgi:alkanesulfonate monooxygenase SsuD/methylene tetrahydromethanopterin reductase-like flavin-dependent oxidoreductase (luciferase family)
VCAWFILGRGTTSEQLQQAILFEEQGRDAVFAGQALLSSNAWTLLVPIAAPTQRTGLGTLATAPPGRRFWKFASRAMCIDQPACGRADPRVALGEMGRDLPIMGESTALSNRAEFLGEGTQMTPDPGR